MKVAIDRRTEKHTGIDRYTSNIYKNLMGGGNKMPLELVNIHDRFEYAEIGYIKLLWRRFFYDNRALPKELSLQGVRVFHNTRNFGGPLFSKIKTVTTVHDVIPHVLPGQYFGKTWRGRLLKYSYEFFTRQTLSKSAKIITISKFSKREIVKYYKVPESKIHVIYEACDKAFRVLAKQEIEKLLAKFNISRPFILSMGGSEYRKNNKTLIEAYKRGINSDYDLIIVGGAWHDLDLSKEYKDIDGLRFMSDIDEAELVALFNAAEVFCFPSFYEGFGLPLLEAMNTATPILAANASCLPEIAGDAALFFDPENPRSLEDKLIKILFDDQLKASLVEKGLQRAKDFSWEDAARQTYELYQEVLAND
ncbi:MAG: glycosyltransferase family 4 protein [Enterococcus sp.]|nr:glycosyltransferase family 4 protein [Enterococcus sp.]